MASRKEQLVLAVMAALNGGSRPGDVPAFVRTRLIVPAPEDLPANTVVLKSDIPQIPYPSRPGSESARASRGPRIQRLIRLQIECLTKAEASGAADSETDPSLVWATKALQTGGGLGIARREPDELGIEYEYDQAACSYCRATQLVEYTIETRTDDPERVA